MSEQVDDKDIKIALLQNENARLNDVNINLQVQIEKLKGENKNEDVIPEV